ncbi:MAG: hypothetical protein A4E71_02923 [Smithella sp. PtaU1.Bin162]|nr:MAG: hypothetical protein A4E71_02923 [Smithella sp. PtaU1.Bin162]
MGSSVKVMLSYDYCHFEISKSTDQETSNNEINEMRKDCMRLADEAIRQYKVAKNMAAKRTDGESQIINFEAQCKKILLKPEGERTLNEIAMIKRYQDEKWREEFQYRYDYEDNEESDYGL